MLVLLPRQLATAVQQKVAECTFLHVRQGAWNYKLVKVNSQLVAPCPLLRVPVNSNPVVLFQLQPQGTLRCLAQADRCALAPEQLQTDLRASLTFAPVRPCPVLAGK
jgi:hypothetical protein